MTERRSSRYAAIRIYKLGSEGTVDLNRELEIFKHIAAAKSSHPGKRSIRSVLDSFHVLGPQGQHWCLVHEPLWGGANSIQQRIPQAKFTKNLLRDFLKDISSALDYLHGACHVIHPGK